MLSRALIVLSLASLLACGSKVEVQGGGGEGGSGSGGGTAGGDPCPCGPSEGDWCECLPTCEWQGQTYVSGDSFPAGDGCNTCECGPNGEVGCTLAYCGGECEYNGHTYQVGDAFPAIDGCNTCSCVEGGVVCTEKACACNPEAEWWREYVSLDPKECEVIFYGCPENTMGFQNDCGCGCEQSPDCPEVFDCMPPSPCDVEAIKKKCPYSKIAY